MQTVETLKGFVLALGAGWVLWLLLALSLVAATVTIERWLYLRGRRGDLRGLAERVGLRLDAGDHAGAIEELSASRAVGAAIATAGLKLAHLGPAAVERAMESARALERSRMQRRLAFLGTLGSNAPFIGLLGTVIGVIHAFEELGRPGPGHGAAGHAAAAAASAAAEVVSQNVMTGIAEALVATAVGIAVALPAVALYNVLQRKVSSLLADAEVLSKLVVAYLTGHAEARARLTAGRTEA